MKTDYLTCPIQDVIQNDFSSYLKRQLLNGQIKITHCTVELFKNTWAEDEGFQCTLKIQKAKIKAEIQKKMKH